MPGHGGLPVTYLVILDYKLSLCLSTLTSWLSGSTGFGQCKFNSRSSHCSGPWSPCLKRHFCSLVLWPLSACSWRLSSPGSWGPSFHLCLPGPEGLTFFLTVVLWAAKVDTYLNLGSWPAHQLTCLGLVSSYACLPSVISPWLVQVKTLKTVL